MGVKLILSVKMEIEDLGADFLKTIHAYLSFPKAFCLLGSEGGCVL